MLYYSWIGLLCALAVPVTCNSKSALIIVDVQECFLQGGSLAVAHGNQVVPVINEIRRKYEKQFSLVILSQDWHCPDHVSFVSTHPGTSLYQVVNLTYNKEGQLCFGDNVPDTYQHGLHCNSTAYVVPQTLWPDHCIQNVTGPTSAAFSKQMTRKQDDVVIRKGFNCEVDSYSAFFDNGGFSQTELNETLSAAGISRVFVLGLALDYCVYYTAKDANRLGFNTYLIQDASRGVARSSITNALVDMKSHGIHIIQSADMAHLFVSRAPTTKKYNLFIIPVMFLLLFT
ncbi:nicotinamidase-like [Gigantopelta aegis]|uniref:nicotinamidase-like n=1 Tax=Gigantopelta aegis TaxID=1735272 RepID=UPI001B88B581|nr:nicotinamidase-like [Gigantopelta aegis]